MEKMRIRKSRSIQIVKELPDGSLRTRQKDYFILIIADNAHLVTVAEAAWLVESGHAEIQEDESQKAYEKIGKWKQAKEKEKLKEEKNAERIRLKYGDQP